jgi:hypothetical protein
MTAHKHLKQLVRSRMAKTGESYTTARRHVIQKAPPPAQTGPAAWHLPGNIPAPTALRILLAAAGARDPQSREPLSEAMVFGIAGGIGIGIATFRYEKADFSSFYIAGRHLWQDDLGYLKAALGRFALKPAVLETAGAKAAEKQLREILEAGAPCVAWVDMTHLPHRGMPQEFSGGGYHLITVYGVDDGQGAALIGDLTDDPVEIALADLATARARIKSFKNRLLSIPAGKSPQDLPGLVRAGIEACRAALTSKAGKGPAAMSTLPALDRWAKQLHGSTDKESWDRLFPRGHLLWDGLMYIHDFIENYHTGGGLCRPLFAEFLMEASALRGLSRLEGVAERYRALGAGWTALAFAAVPADVPAFREARELCAERAELRAAGDPKNAEKIRAVWAQLRALRERARKDFPLTESQTTALLTSLQAQARALYEGEVAACEALGKALS